MTSGRWPASFTTRPSSTAVGMASVKMTSRPVVFFSGSNSAGSCRLKASSFGSFLIHFGSQRAQRSLRMRSSRCSSSMYFGWKSSRRYSAFFPPSFRPCLLRSLIFRRSSFTPSSKLSFRISLTLRSGQTKRVLLSHIRIMFCVFCHRLWSDSRKAPAELSSRLTRLCCMSQANCSATLPAVRLPRPLCFSALAGSAKYSMAR